jgi:lysophospholipase L1-like esterase
LPEFQNNLRDIIKLAKKYSSKIIFVGLTPVDETKTVSLPWNSDKSYKNEYIEKYNKIMKSVSKENKIYFINIFDKLVKSDYRNLLVDGLHPNSKGHQKIFEIVKDFLTENKII